MQTRENFDETRNQTQSLKTKMLEVRQQVKIIKNI